VSIVAVAVCRGGVLSMVEVDVDVDYCRKADVASIP
jgi:hypothetical protein